MADSAQNPTATAQNFRLLIGLTSAAAVCAFGAYALLIGINKATTPAEPVKPYLQVLGQQGGGPGEYQQPRGITGLPDGSFVVVDRAARVQHISAAGAPLTLWSMKDHDLGNPKGICVMPDGNLLVCDTHYGRVLVMSITGDLLKMWGEQGDTPGRFTHPLSAAIDAKRGVAYIVEYGARNDRVQKFDLNGKFLKCWGSFGAEPGEFQRPSGIALDNDGNLYIADAVNHRIQKFDPDGQLLKVWGVMGREPGDLRYPYDIAYGKDGLLYVAEFNNHRVSAFDTDGKFIRCFGEPGNGEGQFVNPWSITVDARGRVLVSDTGNHRIQIFDVMQKQNDKLVAQRNSAAAPERQ